MTAARPVKACADCGAPGVQHRGGGLCLAMRAAKAAHAAGLVRLDAAVGRAIDRRLTPDQQARLHNTGLLAWHLSGFTAGAAGRKSRTTAQPWVPAWVVGLHHALLALDTTPGHRNRILAAVLVAIGEGPASPQWAVAQALADAVTVAMAARTEAVAACLDGVLWPVVGELIPGFSVASATASRRRRVRAEGPNAPGGGR